MTRSSPCSPKLLLGAALAMLSLASAMAQEAGPPSAEPAPPPEEPPAIEASAIAANVESTSATLREIRGRLAPEAGIVAIEGRLSELSKSIGSDAAGIDPEELEREATGLLEAVRQQWLAHRTLLEEWEGSVQKRSRSLDEERATLERLRETWERTRETSSESELPRALRTRIGMVLAEIDEVHALLKERRGHLLTLLDRLAQERIRVGEVLDAVQVAAEVARRRLFTFDAPPLWRARSEPREAVSPAESARTSWSGDVESLSLFLEAHPDAVLGQLVLFGAALILMFALSRRSRRWALEDESLRASAHILGKPGWAALLIALMATRSFHPAAPPALYEVNRLLLLLPVLRLVPGIVPAGFLAPLYGVAVVYILERIPTFLADRSPGQRLIHLIVTALALGLLVWFTRARGRAREMSESRWWRVAVAVSRVGILTLTGSLVANLLGAFSLARVLTAGTLTSAYVGVVLFVGVQVLDGLVTVLLRTGPARKLRSLHFHRDLLRRRWSTLLHLAAAAVWLGVTLRLFEILDLVANAARTVLERRWALGTVEVSVGDVCAFAVAVYLALLVSRLTRFFLEEDVLHRIDLPRGVAGSISMLVHYAVLVFGFVLALGFAGIELSRFALLVGALGIGIGFGLQNIVNNFVSGLILVFERPVKVGDVIEVGTLRGRVSQIGIRASTVRTFEGAEIIVPNGNLVSNNVVNWTLSDQVRRVTLPVGVAYGSDVREVQRILVAAAAAHRHVMSAPEPVALFLGFGESSLDFSLRFWTPEYENWRRVSSDVAVEVYDALGRARIEIPFPQRDLHVRSVDPKARQALGGDGEPV